MIEPAKKTEKIADGIYDRLKTELYTRLLPGDRLTEQSVAERFGGSRTPVREALLRLVQEGYLQAHLRNGYTVKHLDNKSFAELYQLRALFECEAVRIICSQPLATDFGELARTWLIEPGKRPPKAERLGAMNRQFHESLVSASGNAEMGRLHHEVMERIEIVQRLDFVQPDRVEATYEEHGAILLCLRRRHGDAALALVRSHIESSRIAVFEAVQNNPRKSRVR